MRRICSAAHALADIGPDDLDAALAARLPWTLRRRLDAEAPTHVTVPTGSQPAIDYSGADGPVLAVRVQELFGLDRHPAIAGGRVPLILHLLSPAQRPIQITRDLPGFWRGSWAAVKAEMRGRYPKHPWPDDPACRAADTARQAARGVSAGGTGTSRNVEPISRTTGGRSSSRRWRGCSASGMS